ncbi:NfeD family protein [Psychromonas sp. MME2]
MEYIYSHLPQVLVTIGIILLAIEVLVLGFSTFVLFFIGIGTIVTGALMAMSIIPDTVPNSLLWSAIISTIVALLSWKPMKQMQNKVGSKTVNNDIIGHRFALTQPLIPGQTITYHYSGINWQVKAKQPLPTGSEVKIIAMEVGLLTVAPVEEV